GIWRNISAMALLYAQVTAAGHPNEAVLRRTVETGIKTAAAIAMYLWLSSILPLGGSKRWLILALALVAVVGLTVLWRRLIYWHSNLEAELQGILSGANKRVTTADDRCLRPYEEWDMNVAECVLPDLADSSGCTLRELELRKRFGCTVVGVERQGFMVPHTSGDTILYPRDRLLLLGTPAEVAAGKRFLSRVSEENLVGSSFDELRMEAVRVPTRSSREGRTLAELGVTAKTGVQITGILRDGVRILNPGAGEVLASGDELLVMGSPEQISVFKDLLREM
ncbi:MAG TPA: TrkA C-terminal domain-containing protein, partial [Opitutaceae bacterium]|nr:TrkA C-terminal domain-containing protein [Opitutaceae bacterium]